MPNRKLKKRKKPSKELIRSNGVKVVKPTSKSCWLPIKGYEGLYEVSSTGKVRSLPRTVIYESGKKVSLKGKIIEPSLDRDGYLLTHIYKNNVTKCFKVHRLVAQAFIPNPDNLPEVNHKDEDKTNNRVENLEWCTHTYNMNYGSRNKKSGDALRKYLFQRFTLKGEYIDTLSNEELTKLGFKQSVIWRAAIGETKTSSGFRWNRIRVEDAKKFSKPIMRSNGVVVNKPTSKVCWKSFERTVASFFGTKRVPLSGSNSGHNTNSDSMHSELYIECKVREKFSLWSLFDDTEKKAHNEDKIPIVAIKQKGGKGYILMIRPENLQKIAEIQHKGIVESK